MTVIKTPLCTLHSVVYKFQSERGCMHVHPLPMGLHIIDTLEATFLGVYSLQA